MPSRSTSSSSVFGKFKRTHGDSSQVQQPQILLPHPTLLPAVELPLEDRVKLLKEEKSHRRESSILSLTSSVKDLGYNVRRSASLRGHRSQSSSGGIYGHKGRLPSNGNLMTSMLESSASEGAPAPSPLASQTTVPPSKPPPSRGKLSISGRSFSQKIKSTEALPTFSAPDLPDNRPPQTSAGESNRSPFSMLVAPQPFSLKRQQTGDRPGIASPGSFSREPLPPNAPNAQATAGALSGTTTNSSAVSHAGGHDANAVFRQIHETSAKRMATIEYMRRAYEGHFFFFNTLHYTPQAVSHLPSMQTHKLGRRAANYLALGYSLPALLDLYSKSPQEYLKAFSALMQEFDRYQELSGADGSGSARGRMGQMFKSSMGLGTRSAKGRRSSTATDALSIAESDFSAASSNTSGGARTDSYSPVQAGDHHFQHLLTPHLPFDPDFSTTFATLCDALLDSYTNLISMVPSPEVCAPAVGEAFAKADKSVRKILVSNVMREFEDNTRTGVKGEVAGLSRLVLGGLM